MKSEIRNEQDFNKTIKEEWDFLKRDFKANYNMTPRSPTHYYCGEIACGYFIFTAGDRNFPTYFRGSTNCRVSHVDPFTKEGFAIENGKTISNNDVQWYQREE